MFNIPCLGGILHLNKKKGKMRTTNKDMKAISLFNHKCLNIKGKGYGLNAFHLL